MPAAKIYNGMPKIPKPIKATPEGRVGIMRFKRMSIMLLMLRAAVVVFAFVIILHLYNKL
jgi:hypothetical protein